MEQHLTELQRELGRMQVFNHQLHANLKHEQERAQSLQKLNKELTLKLLETSKNLLKESTLLAEAKAAKEGAELVQQELREDLSKRTSDCEAAMKKAKLLEARAVPLTVDVADTLRQLLEAFQQQLQKDIVRTLTAGRPESTEEARTLMLWDIENVGLPPSLKSIDVGDIMTKLTELPVSLGIANHGKMEIIAAHNPRSRDAAADEFFVPAHVATIMTQRRVMLLDVGGKKGAADSVLQVHLNRWLSDTKMHPQRVVIFITGDGDFTLSVRAAQEQGCKTALVYCDHSVNKGSLLPVFERSLRVPWESIVGEDAVKMLEDRQKRKAALQRDRDEQDSQSRSFGVTPGINPRPDLEKTEQCTYHSAGEACPHLERSGHCWYAHGAEELKSRT